MQRREFIRRAGAVGAASSLPLLGAASLVQAQTSQSMSPRRVPDVVFVPTPQEVVETMLRLAKVTRDDVVYDLGCGDGRIVVTAAQRFGARGVGIDIDPDRIRDAQANARAAGVAGRVKFTNGDLFETDFREATVVTLYLLPSLNLKLRPKLLAELKPGTRLLSHDFDMGDWVPDQRVEVGSRTVYYWRIPEKKS